MLIQNKHPLKGGKKQKQKQKIFFFKKQLTDRKIWLLHNITQALFHSSSTSVWPSVLPPTVTSGTGFISLPAGLDGGAARRSSLWSSPCCRAGTSVCRHGTCSTREIKLTFRCVIFVPVAQVALDWNRCCTNMDESTWHFIDLCREILFLPVRYPGAQRSGSARSWEPVSGLPEGTSAGSICADVTLGLCNHQATLPHLYLS